MRTDQRAKETLRALLAEADILLDGRRPWDVRVLDERLYARVLAGGSAAAADAYAEGWWEAARLDQFFHRIFQADLQERFTRSWRARLELFLARCRDAGAPGKPTPAGEPRCRPGADVFQAMLGKRMTFACAYWDGARDLDEAETAKLDLVCRKLELDPGMTVLEYGCGWGAFAKFAAERHGVGVLGVDVAEERVTLGRQACRGLPVELRVQDYREVQGRFDRVVSTGILEHLGPKDYRRCLERAARCLKDDGIAFIHTIARNDAAARFDAWFDRREAPSLRELAAAAEGLFVVEDCQNIGPHFDPTLMAWHANLARAWPSLRDKYGERFYRTMKYCLLSSAGAFRSRRGQVYQLVLTKPGRAQPRFRAGGRTTSPAAIKA
jgi:cyclopropane-fatty-acyl-phospholipid synthase